MFESISQNPSVVALRRQYDGLPARDQLALKVLVVALVVALAYFAAWVPAKNYMESAERQLQKSQEVLATVEANKAALRKLSRNSGSNTKRLDSQQLVSSVTNLAKRQGVALKRFEPSGENKVKVWVDSVSFDKMIAWLAAMDRTLKVSVDQISLETEEESGLVSARLTLSS